MKVVELLTLAAMLSDAHVETDPPPLTALAIGSWMACTSEVHGPRPSLHAQFVWGFLLPGIWENETFPKRTQRCLTKLSDTLRFWIQRTTRLERHRYERDDR